MVHRAIQSHRVVVGDQIRPARVLFEDGTIRAIEAHAPVGDHVHDVGDLVVMPGLVDAHVHINEPGRTDWEGFSTATRAALAGGVTTVVDMPLNCIPVTTSAAALEAKLAACRGQLHVDVGFWGGVVPGNADDLPALAAAGVLGCKAFMIDSGIAEFEWSRREDLQKAMPILRDAGIPLLAHAELDLGAESNEADDPRAYQTYLRSRPAAWEDAAIALLIELCRETQCRVHVVHLSSADSIDQLRRARAEGLPITVETCAHYLCLRAEDVAAGQTHFKCAPPIREEDNRQRLWAALEEGVIDFVVTDHSPCTPHLKLPERGDFMAAWGGIASLQLGLPNVWTEAKQRGIDLPTLSRWISAAPARFAGIGARKGLIAVGHDADFVVWDPDRAHTLQPDDLRFRHKVSPYVGRRVEGEVHETWLRGERIFGDGRADAVPRGRPLLHRDDT